MGCVGLGQHGLCGTGTAWAVWDWDVMGYVGEGQGRHGLCGTVWDWDSTYCVGL